MLYFGIMGATHTFGSPFSKSDPTCTLHTNTHTNKLFSRLPAPQKMLVPVQHTPQVLRDTHIFSNVTHISYAVSFPPTALRSDRQHTHTHTHLLEGLMSTSHSSKQAEQQECHAHIHPAGETEREADEFGQTVSV